MLRCQERPHCSSSFLSKKGKKENQTSKISRRVHLSQTFVYSRNHRHARTGPAWPCGPLQPKTTPRRVLGVYQALPESPQHGYECFRKNSKVTSPGLSQDSLDLGVGQPMTAPKLQPYSTYTSAPREPSLLPGLTSSPQPPCCFP